MHPDDERIDFSPLDPTGEPRRWEALIQRTVAAARPAVHPVWLGVASTGRRGLALAASVALLAWVPALVRPSREATTSGASDAVSEWASWAAGGALPAEVTSTVGAGGTTHGLP